MVLEAPCEDRGEQVRRLRNSARRARYSESRKRATPSWARTSIYWKLRQQARELTVQTGELYVVDHIVPIHSELVCGLHAHTNWRIVRDAENIAKSNHEWPDMPNAPRALFDLTERSGQRRLFP